MSALFDLEPFDEKGRVRLVVETPRGSAIKFKLDEKHGVFTVSRSLALGVTYPFDWGFVPGTMSEDGDPVDGLCLHGHASFPGAVLPCKGVALVDVDQRSEAGRVHNPRVIFLPAWEGAQILDVSEELSDRARAEIETFFLNATLFTDKDARIVGWHGAADAEAYVRAKRI